MLITALLLETADGARVRIPIPRGLPLQEGGIVRSISLGAIRSTDIINQLKQSQIRLSQLKSDGKDVKVLEADFKDPAKTPPIPDAESQARSALAAATNPDKIPVFVEEGQENAYCMCAVPINTGKRCMMCGKLISNNKPV